MDIALSKIDPHQLKPFGSLVARKYATKRLPAVTRIEMVLTEDCTLRCDYCFVHNKDASKRMTWDVAKKSVDFLIDQSPPESDLEITFLGGEPLLEFPLIKRIAKYARNRGEEVDKTVTFALTTNGTIMNEEIARFGKLYGFNLLLSIDGDREVHDLHRVCVNGKGSWDTVVGKNFRLLKSAQGWMGARVTVSPDTASFLSSGIGKLFDLGINQFLIGANMDVEWSQAEMETYAAEQRKVVDFYLDCRRRGLPIRLMGFEKSFADLCATYRHLWGCDAGVNKVGISTEGHLYPCCRFVCAFPGMEGYRLGSLDTGLTNTRTRMAFIDGRVSQRPKCSSCDIADICTGGCFAVNLNTQGSMFIPSDFECFCKRLYCELLARIPKEMLMPDAKQG